MAVSDSFLDLVRTRLGACVPNLRTLRMFGGIGVYAGDLFFAVLDDDELFFKTNDANRGMFVDLGMPAFRPMADRPAMKYHRLPDEALNDPTALPEWIAGALAAAQSSPKSLRKKSAGPRRKR